MSSGYKNRVQLRPLSDLASLAPPDWLISEYIPEGGLATLYGAPNSGKSFVALDMGLCIAKGLDWKGRATKQGAVIYIAMEGIRGMSRRVNAWAHHHSENMDAPFYYTTGFTELITNTSTTDLLRAIEHDGVTPLRLVILDTLSRSLGGADENNAGEMNNALNQLDRISKETGCAVLVIHHTAKHTQTERGSTVLRGSCDTMLYLKGDGGAKSVKLIMDKQRDWEAADPIDLWFQKELDSAVLVEMAPVGAGALDARDMLVYHALEGAYIGSPVSLNTWHEVAGDLPETTFRRIVKQMIDAGLVVRGPGKRGGYVPASRARDLPTD